MNNRNRISSYGVLMAASVMVSLLLIALSAVKIIELKMIMAGIQHERTALMQNEQQLQEMNSLENNREKYENTISFLKSRIPDSPNEYQIIEQMRKASLDHGAEFKMIKFEERVDSDKIVRMPFSVTITGNYASLVGILADISSGERLIKIDKIQISKPEDINGSIQADITASAYYR